MNKLAVITGANSGLGLVTAKHLVVKGYDLVLIIRNKDKAAFTKNQLLSLNKNAKIDLEIADLSDLNAVKKVGENIKGKYSVIDRLINNAGYSADTIQFTKPGYETSFVANHLGHFLLTNTIIDVLKASEDGRIINVSSMAHVMGSFGRMFKKNNSSLSLIQSYADGKLANIMFTKGLLKETENSNINTYSLHPGVVGTNFGANYTGIFKFGLALMKPFMISPEKGAETSIYLATAPAAELKGKNGMYFVNCKIKNTNHSDLTPSNIEQFWQQSAAAVQASLEI
jgi:retinol dehydrogenase 12